MFVVMLGLALAAAPIEDIGQVGAAYVAESGATDVACSQTPAQTVCYGLDANGAVTAATYADGTFTSLTDVATTAAPVPATTSFGEGTWLVNVDIAPGTYRTQVDGDGIWDSCYWARLSDLSGELDAILANENVSGQGLVTIEPTDVAFETGCTWTLVPA
jgi:hypothetical protein